MFIGILLVVFCIQLIVVKADSPSVFPLIQYGTTTRIEDFPFFAATENCGACILSEIWVLTAAHCFDRAQAIANRLVFVGGDRLDNSIRFRYDRIVIHPNYRAAMRPIFYDIALLRLQNPLTFSAKVKPVRLPQWNLRNPILQVVGRGLDENKRPSKSLMKMDVMRLSPLECIISTSSTEYHRSLFDQSIICGTRADGRPGLCYGDSGGPLVQNNTIVGLVSFGLHLDCSKTNIGYYTNVASYVPWIKTVTNLK